MYPQRLVNQDAFKKSNFYKTKFLIYKHFIRLFILFCFFTLSFSNHCFLNICKFSLEHSQRNVLSFIVHFLLNIFYCIQKTMYTLNMKLFFNTGATILVDYFGFCDAKGSGNMFSGWSQISSLFSYLKKMSRMTDFKTFC